MELSETLFLSKRGLVIACTEHLVRLGAIKPDESQLAIEVLERYSNEDLVATLIELHERMSNAAPVVQYVAVDMRCIGRN